MLWTDGWFGGPDLIHGFMLALCLIVSVMPVFCGGKKKKGNSQDVTNITKEAKDMKPKKWNQTSKEKLIAKGELQKGRNEYPTMDDVASDWSSEEEGEDGKKKKKPKGAKPKGGKKKGKKDDEMGEKSGQFGGLGI
ncbi:unnamed protein product [Bursaphelenchus okinawaensis]|uniref:Uncharacterized protein n=1 Tax=Bursaphelenchus okinawaensis TaxID=465554 RepID=A0A811LK02_9BILA|nr:unnamed protein product [Bursaphelenchus okinawaensis]CAG9124491.1 unnamed protein product [Bursaphelenchus okinawaensis]